MKLKIKKSKFGKIGFKKIASLLGVTVVVAAIFTAVNYFNSEKYLFNKAKAAGCNARNDRGVCTEFEYASGTTYTVDGKGGYDVKASSLDGVRYDYKIDSNGNITTAIQVTIGNPAGGVITRLYNKTQRIRSVNGKYLTLKELRQRYPEGGF